MWNKEGHERLPMVRRFCYTSEFSRFHSAEMSIEWPVTVICVAEHAGRTNGHSYPSIRKSISQEGAGVQFGGYRKRDQRHAADAGAHGTGPIGFGISICDRPCFR